MTRLKPRKLDKIRSAFEAVDKVAVDRGDLNDSTKIKELEDKMDNGIIDVTNFAGIYKQRNADAKMKKSHKGLKFNH